MNFKKSIATLILFSFSAIGPNYPQQPDVNAGKLLGEFNKERFPKGFADKAKLAALLQVAVNKMYPDGFRYLGDANDFAHGHILYVLDSGGIPSPVAILYHTQEEAYFHHVNRPKSKYDYLNPQTRNWIQWLTRPKIVENANRYERVAYPSGNTSEERKRWTNFIQIELPKARQRFTLQPWMLDPAATGGEIAFVVTWRFYKIAGKTIINSHNNVIRITLPGGNHSISLVLKITLGKWFDSLLYSSADFEKYLYPR